MRFNHYGKTYQLRIENARDLAGILELDEALWVATSAPVSVFRCDRALVEFLDSNRDGRINTREVRRAIRYLLNPLADPSRVAEGSDALHLAALRRDTPDAEGLAQAARRILQAAGTEDPHTVTLDDVRTFLDQLRKQPMNGDGVIVPAAAPTPETAQYIRDIIFCTGGTDDISGEKGATDQDIESFQARVTAYLDWVEQGRIPDGAQTTDLMPFGVETPALYDILRRHADQVDLFFTLCRAVQFDARTKAHFGCRDADLEDLNDLENLQACLARQPVARPNETGQLALRDGAINPTCRDWVTALRTRLLPVALGTEPDVLTEAEWERVTARFAPYAAYLSAQPGGELNRLPIERLRTYRQSAFRDAARNMIQQDKDVTILREAARELENFLLCHKYLLRFVNNFVSFSQLYAVRENAVFEMGSALIDGRWFSMALKVEDVAAHQQLAAKSNVFTMYVEVSGTPSDEPFLVAIPATSGSKGNLCVGKRGVFFDTADREYNARIVKIIGNPISLREALLSPFVRLWEFVIGKIERMAGSSEASLLQQTDAMISSPPATSAPAAHGPAGMLVGLSLSAAAIGSALAFVAKTLTEMSAVQKLTSLIGALVVVAVPVTLIAVIKLNRQDLSSLLEGCGWAINARMRFNRSQRRQFTRRVALPKGAAGHPGYRWRLLFLLALLLLLIVFVLDLYGHS